MGDWEQFSAEITWFLEPGQVADVRKAGPWTRGAVTSLPELSRLLEATTMTPVSVDGRDYDLLAWGPPERRRGWLTLPPVTSHVDGFHQAHRELLSVFGGIIEQFGAPISWWNNMNEVLTQDAARIELESVLNDYSWLWRDVGLTLPIQPKEFYVVAVEANGNFTIVERSTGQLMLFAPDHAFDGVTPLADCPPYSLMTIDNVPDLPSWIEACAQAWSKVARPR